MRVVIKNFYIGSFVNNQVVQFKPSFNAPYLLLDVSYIAASTQSTNQKAFSATSSFLGSLEDIKAIDFDNWDRGKRSIQMVGTNDGYAIPVVYLVDDNMLRTKLS